MRHFNHRLRRQPPSITGLDVNHHHHHRLRRQPTSTKLKTELSQNRFTQSSLHDQPSKRFTSINFTSEAVFHFCWRKG